MSNICKTGIKLLYILNLNSSSHLSSYLKELSSVEVAGERGKVGGRQRKREGGREGGKREGGRGRGKTRKSTQILSHVVHTYMHILIKSVTYVHLHVYMYNSCAPRKETKPIPPQSTKNTPN